LHGAPPYEQGVETHVCTFPRAYALTRTPSP
jgi:hypothetical protein